MNFESSFAEQIFRSKYLLENETEPNQAVERVVLSVAKIFPEIENEAREYINKQWYVPAGGIWRAAGNPKKNVSHMNCTTLGKVEDNLESIFEAAYKWAKFSALGQGIGLDISNLRPKNSIVHNSSKASTGAVSFMYIYDIILKIIAQQGRRGASLISISDSHPDIIDFIHVKDKSENDKSRIDTANTSIQVTDEFMHCVVEDKEWTLHFENKYEVIEKKVKAKEIFDEICTMAWKRGDPGLQFIDKANRESNSNVFDYNSETTNACSEIFLDAENVCNLGQINLSKYKEYDEEGLKKLIKFAVKFGVAIINNELVEERSPTKKQQEKLIQMPRIGLGFTGFADYLLDHKIVYGSQESIEYTSFLFKTLAKYAYKTNHDLGKELGSFPTYNKEKMKQSLYIQRLLSEHILEEENLNYQYCITLLAIAPSGTSSIISNCGGSGIEPLFSKYMVRRERATTGEYKEWFTFNPYVERYLKEKGLEVTKENVDTLVDDYWVMSYDVHPLDKIKLVAEAQKWIDSSISVTFNIPEDSTIEDVKNIYIEAWKHELKGVTVYREGSLSGILITEKNYNKNKKAENTKDKDYIPRPESLPCDIYEMKYKENKFIILIGLQNDEPYECFITPNDENEIDVEKHKKGFIVKKKAGNYDLIVENGIVKTMINNIGKTFDSLYGTLSRMVSMSLRHKVPLQFIVDQLNKDSGFIAFEKVLSRVLKKYIKDGEFVKHNEVCPECGSVLIYKDGCKSCSSCSWSRCV